ncbi:MAG: hypothetical protein DMF80_00485 [Acidobacteria bacterium]|nr:MAG: hypothetical protein DMF80_00485 [Acidobacteriota bacterium]PYQ18062.1 MAG: hypothetical protein DMF81_26075 [Acidobacteriota bacterium]
MPQRFLAFLLFAMLAFVAFDGFERQREQRDNTASAPSSGAVTSPQVSVMDGGNPWPPVKK